MIKFRKTLFPVVMVILMLSFIFTGCAAKNTQKSTQTPASSGETTVANPTKDFVQLNMVYPFGGTKTEEAQKMVQDKVNAYLKDKLNCSLTLVPIDWSQDPMNKIELMITAGQQADIVFSAGWSNFFSNAAKGAYLPLNDLLDKYAAETKSTITPGYLNGPVIDGKLYAIPTDKEIAQGSVFEFDKATVDKYNLDVSKVTCLEDMEPLFAAIKNSDPNMIPWNITNMIPDNDSLYGRFSNKSGLEAYKTYETVSGTNYLLINTETGKVVSTLDTPFEIDRFKLINKYYKAGYINSDSATSKTDPNEVLKNNKTWFGYDVDKPGVAAACKLLYGRDFIVNSILTPKITTDQVTGSMLSISKNCTNPERAMMVLNLLHTDKTLLNLIVYGVEGVHYQKVNDTTIQFMPNTTKKEESGYGADIAWEIGSIFNQYIYTSESPAKYQEYKDFNSSAENSKILGFNVDMEPVKSENAAVNNAINLYQILLMSGAAPDVDQTISEAKTKASATGIDKVIAEVQKQYDAWKAANNK